MPQNQDEQERIIGANHPLVDANQYQTHSLGAYKLPGEYDGPYCITDNGDYIIRFLMMKFPDFIPFIKRGEHLPVVKSHVEAYTEQEEYQEEVSYTEYTYSKRGSWGSMASNTGKCACASHYDSSYKAWSTSSTVANGPGKAIATWLTNNGASAWPTKANSGHGAHKAPYMSGGQLIVSCCAGVNSSGGVAHINLYFNVATKKKIVTKNRTVTKYRHIVDDVDLLASTMTESQRCMIERIRNSLEGMHTNVEVNGQQVPVPTVSNDVGELPVIPPEAISEDNLQNKPRHVPIPEQCVLSNNNKPKTGLGAGKGAELPEADKTTTMVHFPGAGIAKDDNADEVVKKIVTYLNTVYAEDQADLEITRAQALAAAGATYAYTAFYEVCTIPYTVYGTNLMTAGGGEFSGTFTIRRKY